MSQVSPTLTGPIGTKDGDPHSATGCEEILQHTVALHLFIQQIFIERPLDVKCWGSRSPSGNLYLRSRSQPLPLNLPSAQALR